MLLGFNLLLWASQITEEHFPLFAKIKAAGYDGVELPLFGGKPEDYVHVGREIRNNGLRATAVCVIPDKEHDCTSSDPKARAAGLAHLKWALDCLEAAGGEVLCGPFYQPLGIFSGDPPTPEERAGIVEVHKAAARHARQGRHQDGGRAAQPLRVLRAQHGRPTPPRSSGGSTSRTTGSSTTPSTPTSRRRTRSASSPRTSSTSSTSTPRRTTAARPARAMCRGPPPSRR